MNKINNYDIVLLGNYTKDTIVSKTGTRQVDGGGFNYGAHVARMMGLRTAAVTRLARSDAHVVDALTAIGVDAFPAWTPYSTDMRLYYPTDNVDNRILSVTHTAGSFTPDQFTGLEAKAFLINASARGEVDLDVISFLRKKHALLSADAQGFVRIINGEGVLEFDSWEAKSEVLPYFDILKTDAVEARTMTGEEDIRVAARMIAGLGPKEVVLSHRDGLLVLADGEYYEAPFLPEPLVGRSGRGDTCIAAYVCKRLTAGPAEATIWAAAVTSLKMEAEGPIKRSVADVELKIAKRYTPR
ncbi:MAG TPA: PfkB family carbohydrate kinase [bacterium]|nr:PfkB family carbohydrate kinase [bacterium]